MNTSSFELEELVRRVQKLERENRQWKRLLLAFAVLLLAVAGTAMQNTPRPETLRAKSVEAEAFVLRDGTDQLLGKMTIEHGQGSVVLYGPQGKETWSAPPQTGLVPLR